MSEKRFVLWRSEDRDGYTDEWAVDDTLTGKRIDEDEVVVLLNQLHQENKMKDIEIQSLNLKIKDWYNDSAIAKLYEKEQDKTEMLEKAYEECNAKWEKLFVENKKLKYQLEKIPPKIKEVWLE